MTDLLARDPLHEGDENSQGAIRRIIIPVLIFMALLAPSQITFFVIQSTADAPDGVTLLMSRRNNTRLIDSTDAFCLRQNGNVDPGCRDEAISKVSDGASVIARLPYSQFLFDWSTEDGPQ